MTRKQHFLVTLGMVTICFLLAISIPNIGDAITLTGATINPFIGFIFPIMFYLKLDPLPLKSPKKVFAIFVAVFIAGVSVLGLLQFF